MTRRTVAAYAAVMAILSGTLLGLRLSDRREMDTLDAPLETIGSTLAGWTMAETAALTPGLMNSLRPTSYVARAYAKGTNRMAVFIAYYAFQRAGETMHSPKSCLPGEGWEVWKARSIQVPFRGRQVEIKQYSIRNAYQRLTVLYWYQSRKRILSNEYTGKFLLVRDAVLEGRTSGSLVRLTLPDTEELMPEALAFTGELMEEVQRCIGD